MDNRLAVISIIVNDTEASSEINKLLHDFSSYIVGRMGMPYKKRDVSIICIVMDAPEDVISSLSGKLGMLKRVSIKTTFSKK
ncbi:MAG: iron-only hydrogenase system regulator [Clostridiaceae bacterium]|nr:iron-only hydrogenase system regulator [Clostridiaceae bacterium]